MKRKEKPNQLVIYQTKSGEVRLRGDFDKETIWATLNQIAELFGRDKSVISRHIKNIFKIGELDKEAVVAFFATTAADGKVYQMEYFNLDMVLSVGYRVNSKTATLFRQWVTTILRQHITKGFTINPAMIKNNYAEFQKAIENIRALLPAGTPIDHASVLELISTFANTWLSLEVYDEDSLPEKGVTKKNVELTVGDLESAFAEFKISLNEGELFGVPRQPGAVAGIVGSVMQTFGGRALYATVEERAAHLLYFFVKNHPFIDGNKRHGAFAFVWFLRRARIFEKTKITPPALTAITLFVAESNPKNKEQVIRFILQLLKK